MTATRHFAAEMLKVAFSMKAPPVMTSAMGKTTKGVVAKPMTLPSRPAVKTPQVKTPKSVPTAGGSNLGSKIDPARSNPPPPPVYGGDNVQ